MVYVDIRFGVPPDRQWLGVLNSELPAIDGDAATCACNGHPATHARAYPVLSGVRNRG